MQSNLQNIHIAIIMDGNGRWAQKKDLPRFKGHSAGVSTLRNIIQCCPEFQISTLTLYAFSSDNWKRPQTEISHLMDLIRLYLSSETDCFLENNIRFKAIGRRDRLPEDIVKLIEKVEHDTQCGEQLTLRVAIDYSSRYEILQAAKNILDNSNDSHSALSKSLSGVEKECDVDLLIRTSGEKRLSDFLLWECAYSELYFTNIDWPDFTSKDLRDAVEDFRSRDRRFGSLEAETKLPPVVMNADGNNKNYKIAGVK